tara:strand:+ start:2186 stop:2929 length:744 start_codon:yes stop_codon:yes gene_type:complete
MKILKFVYKSFLSGMPFITYNPITNVPFHAPFDVKPESLYINYKLNNLQYETISKYINKKNSDFTLLPIRIAPYDTPSYYLSLNIYNCTSPLFMNDNGMTRFEINTYVTNKQQKGTLIIDYISSALSMDPVNIFKNSIPLKYNNGEIMAIDDNILLNASLKLSDKDSQFYIDKDLAKFSDIIFYTNGIYDKLFYDTSLTEASVKIPTVKNLQFNYINLTFSRPDSIFYFKNEINFVGAVWQNLFNKK